MNIRLAAAADVTTSVTRWHDHFSIFSFIQPGNICPIPLPIINIAKVGSKYCQILTNPENIVKYLMFSPKWLNFTNSGHTEFATYLPT